MTENNENISFDFEDLTDELKGIAFIVQSLGLSLFEFGIPTDESSIESFFSVSRRIKAIADEINHKALGKI